MKDLAYLTSGKSTQNAFIFKPYRKLPNDSVNRSKLSCISWKCIKLASRSAMPSASSANEFSKILSGNADSDKLPPYEDSRKDDCDVARSGVVGRGVRARGVVRFIAESGISLAILLQCLLSRNNLSVYLRYQRW